MNKLKALIVTLVVGSSSVAMASPATFSARGSVSFAMGRPVYQAPRTVVVRDHRQPDYRYIDDRNDRNDYRDDVRDEHCATFSLTGTYTSAYGPVQLWQHGDRITGTFSAGGGGTIEGRIIGNQIVFRWRNSKEQGRGVWFVSSPNRIDGTWGTSHSNADGGAWNLSKRA